MKKSKGQVFIHFYEIGEPVEAYSYNEAMELLEDGRPGYVYTFYISEDRKNHDVQNMQDYLPAYRRKMSSEYQYQKSISSSYYNN